MYCSPCFPKVEADEHVHSAVNPMVTCKFSFRYRYKN